MFIYLEWKSLNKVDDLVKSKEEYVFIFYIWGVLSNIFFEEMIFTIDECLIFAFHLLERFQNNI